MECWHMSGAGNDFMVLDGRNLELDLSDTAKKLCALKNADGCMVLTQSECADFRLHFYNRDGSRGEMCGNGSRCVCRFAHDHGMTADSMVIQTDSGLVLGWRLGETEYRVALNLPSVLELERKPGCAYVELGAPGVPHAVLPMETLDTKALRPMARALRQDAAFPKGANVNFYALDGKDYGRILTYERGVEDYTQACGTGAASVAAVLWAQGRLPEKRLRLTSQGGALTVRLEEKEGKLTSIYLDGPAEVLEILDVTL